MFKHNVILALRNLWKYKLQTVICILSLSVGLGCVGLYPVFGSYGGIFSSTKELDGIDAELHVFQFKDINTNTQAGLPLDVYKEMRRNRFASIDKWVCLSESKMAIKICVQNGKKTRQKTITGTTCSPNYLQVAGMKSAITGKVISTLKPSELVLMKQEADMLFGSESPIGKHVTISFSGNTYDYIVKDVLDPVPGMQFSPLMMAISEGDDRFLNNLFYINVYAKKGVGYDAVEKEINRTLKPYSLCCEMNQDRYDDVAQKVFIAFEALILSILLTAFLCYLRMFIQQIMARRHEVALRNVMGAKKSHLFAQFMMEPIIIIAVSMGIAILMAFYVKNLIMAFVTINISDFYVTLCIEWILNMKDICLRIGVHTAAMICVIAVFLAITISRMEKSVRSGLASKMRHSRSHMTRTVMLTFQFILSIVFATATLCFYDFEKKGFSAMHIPDDTEHFDNLLVYNQKIFDTNIITPEEIASLKGVEYVSSEADQDYYYIDGLSAERQEINAERTDRKQCIAAMDTSILRTHQINVHWLKPSLRNKPCVIINKSEYDALNNIKKPVGSVEMMIGQNDADYVMNYPIAGYFDNIPLEYYRDLIILNRPEFTSVREFKCIPYYSCTQILIKAKNGKKELVRKEIGDLFRKKNPGLLDEIVFDYSTPNLSSLIAFRFGKKILTIITLMSIMVILITIYSAVQLDCRSRQKEVAIRKINGATHYDICMSFTRSYLISFATASVAALMFVILISNTADSTGIMRVIRQNIYFHLLLTTVGIAVLITMIIWSMIKQVMLLDPATAIKAE
ncbi:MAG: ABC transporter permease [Bacteroidaceae bacterium]|nr:ABC transporter permease [Bacteroidaceae bacterium]